MGSNLGHGVINSFIADEGQLRPHPLQQLGLANLGLGQPVAVCEQRDRVYTQGAGKPVELVDSRRLQPPLQTAHICPATDVREIFLAQASDLSEISERLPEVNFDAHPAQTMTCQNKA